MSGQQATSFHKVSKQKLTTIRGARVSVSNSLFLTSTGVPSLDALLGGGVAVGTVLLIEEDAYAAYTHVLQKYFLAEGVMCGHTMVYSSLDRNPSKVMEELPAATDEEPVEAAAATESSPSSEQQMTIAWRYKNKPQVQSSSGIGSRQGHYFDLTKSMPTSRLSATEVTTLGFQELCDSRESEPGDSYAKLLSECSRLLDAHAASSADKDSRNVLRIAISGLGSPLWGDEAQLPRVLLALRGLARSGLAVLQISVPSHVCQNATLCRRLERLADYAIRLESFAGSEKEKNPAFKEYHGMLHIRHLARLNSLLCGPSVPREGELAFKLRRKKFTIETLHLPPELAESASRPQEDTPRQLPRSSCAQPATLLTAGKALDF